jgi:hypothetical protein
LTKSEIKSLEERVQRLKPANSDTTQKLYHRIVRELSQDERIALARAIKGADEAGRSDEAWLATRPQDQQAVVGKVSAQIKRLALEEESK